MQLTGPAFCVRAQACDRTTSRCNTCRGKQCARGTSWGRPLSSRGSGSLTRSAALACHFAALSHELPARTSSIFTEQRLYELSPLSMSHVPADCACPTFSASAVKSYHHCHGESAAVHKRDSLAQDASFSGLYNQGSTCPSWARGYNCRVDGTDNRENLEREYSEVGLLATLHTRGFSGVMVACSSDQFSSQAWYTGDLRKMLLKLKSHATSSSATGGGRNLLKHSQQS